jgi:DNA-binding XRE family transcriptional regulator
MNEGRRRRLSEDGWRVGSVDELLGLSDDEIAYIEIFLALAGSLRKTRRRMGLTQLDLAKRIGSSQSRVAKMEAADPTVTIDRILRAHLTLGVSAGELAEVIGQA